jgi:hypothetical protein
VVFFDTETGEMLPQATRLPIADALLDLDEQGCPGEIVTYVYGVWSNETAASRARYSQLQILSAILRWHLDSDLVLIRSLILVIESNNIL